MFLNLNYLNFYDTSFPIFVLYCFIASVHFLIYYPVGKYFINDNIIIQSFIGLMVSAIPLIFLSNHHASLGRLYIYLINTILIANFIFKFKRIYIKIITFLFIGIFLFNLLIILSLSPNVVDGHDMYFAGPSLEIFQANYPGRLRVFDQWPAVFGKYHFYNNSVISLLMPLYKMNYLIFLVAKHSLIIVSAVTIMIYARKFLGSFLHSLFQFLFLFLILILLCPGFMWWSFYTLNFISLFLALFILLSLIKNDLPITFLLLPFFALSSARNVFITLPIVFWVIFKQPHYVKNPKLLLFYTISFLSICSMVLSGTATQTIINTEIMSKLNFSWLSLIPSSVFAYDGSQLTFSNIQLRLMYIFAIVFLLILSFTKKFFFTSQTLLAQIFLTGIVVFSNYELLSVIIMCLIIPVISTLFLPNIFRIHYLLLLCISIFQIFVFELNVSVPIYIILFLVPYLFLLIRISSNLRLDSLKLIVINSILTLFIIYFCLFSIRLFQPDPNRSSYYLLNQISNNNVSVDIEFRCFSDVDSALISSRLGRRNLYSPLKPSSYFISKDFVDLTITNRDYSYLDNCSQKSNL